MQPSGNKSQLTDKIRILFDSNFDLYRIYLLKRTVDKIKKNREFIVRYYNAISGVIKTDALCEEFMTDQKLINNIKFFDGAFPAYELFIDEMVAENNKVMIRGRATGIHKAEFNGIPPTYKKNGFTFCNTIHH